MTIKQSANRTVPPTRREMLQLAGAPLLTMFPASGVAAGSPQAEAGPANPMAPLNRFPRMVHEYFVDRVRAAEEAAEARRAALRTKADAEAYIRDVRQKIHKCFGPLPEKNPLNARITGVVERDQYKIEKVLFESRPGFLVTANLYVPKGRNFPLPGVVGTCGHSSNGKAAEAYQSFSQGLARMGYVVLIYDPIGQGERLQYTDEKLQPRIGTGTREHLHGGNQQFLVNEFFGTWRAWDGIRALDYLLSREEVDNRHVGVTGNSGGGTMTTWLCGLESRWTMAAPSCFVTTFRRNMENELPADTEQCPPNALALELDHHDFLAAMAPKPVIVLAKEKDYFDVRGNKEAYRRLQRLYRLLGAEQNVGRFVGPTYHGYSKENREAMYRWFNQVTGVSDAQKEPKLVIEDDETLFCTPRGQVAELDSRTLFSFTRSKSQALARRRSRMAVGDLRDVVSETLQLPKRQGVPEYRILRTRESRNYPTPHSITYAVNTGPGIHAIVYRLSEERIYSRPPRGPERAVLYVSHHSADAELREEPLIKELLAAESEIPFFTCDVRGIGDARPETCGINSFLEPYGSDYFYAIHSIMFDNPYAAQKTHDLLRVLDWLESVGHREVHLAAKGWGAIPATFAAMLCDRVMQVTLKNALTSYREVAESGMYDWPLSSFVPGVLERFDLPDCYRALEVKGLRQLDPWGANAGKA